MSNTSNSKLNNKKKRWIILLFSFLFILISAWFLIDRWAKRNGFSGAGDAIKTVTVNYWNSFDAKYESIEITISESDFAQLESQRNKHLQRGIITKLDERYVPAIITYDGKKIKCKLRLKGHMTDHLQDEKWSFRVKTVGGDAFQGMKIFSLMHPGTRNYIYEWIYHQLLEQEGIATVRYSFINMKVNGDSWGIFAVEENFSDQLLDHHRLPKGPILGFNPDLYWNARLNEFDRKNVDLENKFIQASFAEAYDEKENFKDDESKLDYLEAIVKLEKFKRGELKTSEVFDTDKLAKFHAVLDLVGGQFSIDWSDVKYYYNPSTELIEPVGYESFSVQNTSQLSGAGKFRNKHDVNSDWHEYLFSDKEFFHLYTKHLKRISKTKYLDDFFRKKDKELRNNLNILYTEFPYKKLPLEQYYINQNNIKSLLQSPIIMPVYLEKISNDSLYLTFGCNSYLPLEIQALSVNESKINITQTVTLSARAKNQHLHFETHVFPLNAKMKLSDIKEIKLEVSYSGNNNTTELEVKPISLNEQLNLQIELVRTPNTDEFDFLTIDEEKKAIFINSGEHQITKDMILPDGYQIIAKAPLILSLENHSRIISFSPVKFTGTEENPIRIQSLDSTGSGIVLIDCKTISEFSFTQFIGQNLAQSESVTHNASLYAYQSPIRIQNSVFSSEGNNGIYFLKSRLVIKNSEFFNFKNNAIRCLFSDIKFEKVNVNSSKTAFKMSSSDGTMTGIKAKNADVAFKFDNGSSIKINNSEISDCKIGIHAINDSDIKINQIKLNKLEIGFKAEKKSDVFGPSIINAKSLKRTNVKSISESDRKSKITIE